MTPALSVVIPTWNGLDLLQRFLPSVVAEGMRWSAATGHACEIVISDDGSTDATRAWVGAQYPAIVLVASPANQGFAPAANAGCLAARSEIVVLLNNDLDVVVGAFDPIPAWFADGELFGVTLQGRDLPHLNFGAGGKLGRFRRGYWNTWRNFETDIPGLPSFMLVGGFCAFRRSVFAALGGFDRIFAPYYWEDVDLSYRARKRGWKVLYEPRAVVHHAQSASVVRHKRQFQRAAIIERNRFLFHWRNLGGAKLLQHLAWSHLMLLQMLVKGNFAYHAGYAQALRRLGSVRRFRAAERPHWRVADSALAVANSPAPLRFSTPIERSL